LIGRITASVGQIRTSACQENKRLRWIKSSVKRVGRAIRVRERVLEVIAEGKGLRKWLLARARIVKEEEGRSVTATSRGVGY